MRLSFLPVLVAGAGMIASQVVAEPIRLIVDAPETNPNIRFGHVLANANVNGNDDSQVARVRPTFVMATSTEVKSSIREKAVRLSNAFRHALGLPIIETGEHHPQWSLPSSGSPITSMEFTCLSSLFPPWTPRRRLCMVTTPRSKISLISPPTGPERPHHPHKDHSRKHKKFRKFKGFFRRIHKALTTLGPWEGRAVAFVLGCGIGVLLRMFWVLSVLLYRTVRGEREEQDVETVFVAPPQYTDEKYGFIEDVKRPVDV
ncbi:hypothetical protein EDC04DRAFT_2868671 [Pisolithus marmoratus]|nr:hypothetical protein EDC04DRAFT_2868671 [Pisolithus marmoratus]